MTSTAVSPLEYTWRTTVQIFADRVFLGSGFFVRRGIVVTCAHVVASRAYSVTVVWKDARLAGTVVVLEPAERGEESHYAFPDLALIQLLDLPDHPEAFINPPTRTPLPGKVTALGYRNDSPDPGVVQHALRLEIVGRDGRLTRVKDDEIPAGLSGAPVIDSRTGEVYGVVKASRDFGAARGGWIIPVTEVVSTLNRHQDQITVAPQDLTPRMRPSHTSPLGRLLAAQLHASERLPYRLVEGPAPPLSAVYVQQRAEARSRRSTAGPPGPPELPVRSVPELLTTHRHALIVGGPGSGKSTLVQQIVAETARWWLGGPDSEAPAPPFGACVALRAAAMDLLRDAPWLPSLASAVSREVASHLDRPVDPEMFKGSPTPEAEWLILVDGLDEILDLDRRQRLIEALSVHIGEYGTSMRFVVTTRPLVEEEFAHLRRQLFPSVMRSRYGEYTLRVFDAASLQIFARRWFDVRTPGSGERYAGQFLQRVTESDLGPIVEVPLLATIAAVVFEREPESPLPVDRTGLYETFVLSLLDERRARIQTRQAIREQLATYGSLAEQFGEYLFDHTEDCLGYLARHLLTKSERFTIETAMSWLKSQQVEVPRVPRLRDHLRELLLSTGLLSVQSGELEFVHQSFAEYLAAGGEALESFDPSTWRRSVRRDGLDNISMFTLTRWVRRGNDPLPLLNDLLRPGLRLTYPDLPVVCTLLEDGLPMDPDGGADLVARALRCIRRRRFDEGDSDLLQSMLRALRRRDGDGERVRRLAADPKASVLARTEALCVLALAGPEAERAAARAALIRLGTTSGEKREERLWALHELAGLGDHADREFALARIADTIETAVDEASRGRAVNLLARLEELEIAIDALLARLTDPRLPSSHRQDVLDALLIVLPETVPDEGALLDPFAAFGASFSGYFMPWTEVEEKSAVRTLIRIMYSERMMRVDQIGAALALISLSNGDAVTSAIRRITSTTLLTWPERMRLARTLEHVGLSPAARELLALLVQDRHQSGSRRAEAAALMIRYGDTYSAAAVLDRWFAGEAGPQMRFAALWSVTQAGHSTTALEWAQVLLDDPRLPTRVRLDAAFLLARVLGEFDQALLGLDGWKRAAEWWRPMVRVRLARRILSIEGWHRLLRATEKELAT